jgi:plastocyanin
MTVASRLGLALLFLVASACAGPATDAGPATTDRIDMPRSYLFRPADIAVAAETTVTWTNSDQFTHTVRLTATGEVLGTVRPGGSLTYTFAHPGRYAYDCSLHPQNMKGTVTVR